jgi:DNA (cytosine-5)-methyltransferase 1
MPAQMTFGSLFAGIGGMDLGLERAGMKCSWQVEISEYATRVLAKHWPDVPRFRDVREVGRHNLSDVDLICGGFPCQDISSAGKQEGITGARSGLWSEYFRIICELQPRFVLVENVAALLVRGLDRVLGNLASCGYDAEWQVLSACQFGLPQTRERLFIIAYPQSQHVTTPIFNRTQEIFTGHSNQFCEIGSGCVCSGVSRHAEGHEGKPRVPRVTDVFPSGLDRLRGLGNAVVPQVAQWIGERIIEHVSVTNLAA